MADPWENDVIIAPAPEPWANDPVVESSTEKPWESDPVITPQSVTEKAIDHRGIVLKSLQDYGVSPVATAAIMGDIEQESAFSPRASGDHGTSRGLLQTGVPMFRQYEQTASNNGIELDSPDYVYGQVPFVLERFKQQHPDRWNAMQDAENPEAALAIFRGTKDWGYGIAGKRYDYANRYAQLITPQPWDQDEVISRPQAPHSASWNASQQDMADRAAQAGMPAISGGRDRLIDAISRSEKAGYPVQHFAGTPNEPTGDRAPTIDIENLINVLKSREAKGEDVSKERAYWENELKSGMTAEQWRQQTGEADPSAPQPSKTPSVETGQTMGLKQQGFDWLVGNYGDKPIIQVPKETVELAGRIAFPGVAEAVDSLKRVAPAQTKAATEGLSQSAAGAISGMTTPINLGLLGATILQPELGLPAWVGRATALGFSAASAHNMYQAAQGLEHNPGSPEWWQSLGDVVINGAFTTLAGVHGLSPRAKAGAWQPPATDEIVKPPVRSEGVPAPTSVPVTDVPAPPPPQTLKTFADIPPDFAPKEAPLVKPQTGTPTGKEDLIAREVKRFQDDYLEQAGRWDDHAAAAPADIKQELQKKAADLRKEADRASTPEFIKTFIEPKIKGLEKTGTQSVPQAKPPVAVPFGFGPGAAASGETLRPSAPTAKQLADFVKDVQTAKPNKFAKTIGRATVEFGKFKTALQSAAATVKNLAHGFKRLVWDPPSITNFDRWKGEWDDTLQYNDFHIKRLGHELERAVPDLKRQEAVYNFAAADGDQALLKAWAESAPKDVKQGYLDALHLSDEEVRLANLMRSAYDEWLERAVENGMLREGTAAYMKRVVVKRPGVEADALARIGTGKFTTNFKESKRRFWKTMVDAEREGIRYDKRLRGQALYAQSFEHALINRTAVRQFFDGQTETGRPFAIVEGNGTPIPAGEGSSPALLVTPFGARNVRGATTLAGQLRAKFPSWSEGKALAVAREKILAEYEPLDHPAFKNWQWVNTLEDGTQVFVRGDALVHRSLAPKLRNAFEKDRIDWLEPILRVQGFVKGSKLSLSLFHNVHEAVNAAGHLTNPVNLRPLGDYLEMPEIRTGMRAGLKLVGNAHEQAYFAEGMGSHGWPELVPVLGEYVKAFKDASFEDWIPRLKAEAYLLAYERNAKGGVTRLRPTKNLSPEQNAVLTARQVNATFGEQNYRQMMRDPRLQQALQGLFLAPDFGEAKLRHIGQAFTRYGSEQRMAIGLVAAGLYLGSRILNQVFNGHPYWSKPFSVVAGDREYSLRSLPGDLIHLLGDWRSYVKHRLSPTVQNVVEALFHRDIRGQVTDWADEVKDFFLSVVPIPLTHRQGLSWKDQLASAMGLTPMVFRYENELRKVVADYKSKSTDPKIQRQLERDQKETFLPSDHQPMRDALRQNKLDVAADEYRKLITLKGGKPSARSEIFAAMSQWQHAPFTGSASLESKFKRSLKSDELALYNSARQERHVIWQRFMRMRRDVAPANNGAMMVP